MTELVPPLVPACVDLTDFSFMPLDVRRLRDSKLAASVNGESFRCTVLLWCASWHQVPAASLPDDDIELAQLAGFGRAVAQWKKARKGGALYGWVKCSDGRLYHPVVAEKAKESWQSKLESGYRRECDRLRKENKRRAENQEPALRIPSFEQWEFQRTSVGIPADGAKNPCVSPADSLLKGQGQGEVRDRERDPLPSESRADENRPPTGKPTKAAEVCLAVKAEGIIDASPSYQPLLALLEEGAETEEFVQAARASVAMGKGFRYVVGKVRGQRQDAAQGKPTGLTGPLPGKRSKSDDDPFRGIQDAFDAYGGAPKEVRGG